MSKFINHVQVAYDEIQVEQRGAGLLLMFMKNGETVATMDGGIKYVPDFKIGDRLIITDLDGKLKLDIGNGG